jgi:hypothetical protein
MSMARLLCWFAVAVAVAGCADRGYPGDGPSGPDANLLGGGGLVSCTPLDADEAAAIIGPEGGAIQVGPHVLAVPAGALAAPVTITARLRTEPVNRVEFQPAGLTFQAAATLSMDYANCGGMALLVLKRIAYVDDASLDILGLPVSLDDLLQHRVSARLTHFSSYAIAW